MRPADHPPSHSPLHKGSRIELLAVLLLALLVLIIVDGVVLLLHSW